MPWKEIRDLLQRHWKPLWITLNTMKDLYIYIRQELRLREWKELEMRNGDFIDWYRENVIRKQWKTPRGNCDLSGVGDTENTYRLRYFKVFYF